jgi:hypothetical protein
MRLIRSAFLVAALLLAQAATAAHFDLDDSHPPGDSCALCAGHAALGAGNVGTAALAEGILPASPPMPGVQTFKPQSHRSFFFARGPPAAS